MSTGAVDLHGGRRLSLPLLISLFLAALVGVFPAAGALSPISAPTATAISTPVISTTVISTTATTATATSATVTADATENRGDLADTTAPAPDAGLPAPAPAVGTAVGAPTGQDVHPARAPRAPPLLLV